MGSRIEIEKLQKKVNILNVSKLIFEEKSFENATIDEIARSVGVAKGSIYTYFKSKDDILANILANSISKLITDLNTSENNYRVILEEYKERNSGDISLFKYLPLMLDHQVLVMKINELKEIVYEKYGKDEFKVKEILSNLIFDGKNF